jgi:glycosyltransferase involved in cell wall biosynthesis
LCEAVSRTGRATSALAPFCAWDEQVESLSSIEIERYPLGNTKWRGGDEVIRRLEQQIARSTGLHIHGLWQEHCAVSATMARKRRKPYLISAHGMLDPWALGRKRWKKRLYSLLVEHRNLEHAACLHALTEKEADDYRRFGLSNPIVVVPYGVAVPDTGDARAFLRAYPELAGKRIVLFLGRMHSAKGLDLLCRAWKDSSRPADAHLVLAGPDSNRTMARLKRLVSGLDIASSVTFTGMLRAEERWDALAAAETFVLPSRSEGLSVSALEAMASGRPVIVTPQCNLPEVRTRECGWVVEPGERELTTALNEYFESSAGHRFMMGLHGRRLAEEKYSWPAVARQMADVYEWLARGGAARLAQIDLERPAA